MNVPAKLTGSLDAARGQGFAPLAPPLERRRLQSYLGLMLCDSAAILGGLSLAAYGYLGARGAREAFVEAQVLLPIYLTVALYNSSYAMDVLMRPRLGMLRALVALAISVTTIIFIAFYTKSSAEFSRVAFTGGIVMAAGLMLVLRGAMRHFVRWRCGAQVFNELLILDGGPRVDLPTAIVIEAHDFGLKPDLGDPHALDRIGLVLRHIDRVVVSCAPELRRDWAMTLKGASIDGEVIDDVVTELGAQGARTIGGHGSLLVSRGALGIRARAMKRLLDISLAGAGLILLSPVMLLAALAIWLEDGRPVLFLQQRLGRGNRFFTMFKFRSMKREDADPAGSISTTRDDDRMTRVGRFIRRTSIDELPQLFNVLRGDMSLVGPRPHAIGSQAGDKLFWEVDSRYWQRHSLKPGLSGLAQVRGFRGATEQASDLANRLNADLEYLEGWTIWRDLRIIWLTLRVIVHDRAY